MSEMKKVFAHPVQRKEAATRLLTLRHGSQSVASYAIEFRILAVESGWNKVAIQGAFVRGLSEEIKDALAARDETDSLEALMSLSVCLDNHLRERRREKAGHLKMFSPNSQSPELATASLTKQLLSLSSYHRPLEFWMQLGRAHLTPAEQQRMIKEVRCIYWPSGSLPVQLLPEAKREGSPVNQGVLVSQTSSKDPSPALRVQLPASLLWSQQTLPLPTLVDSGADDNFIDSDLVLQANIPAEEINPPKDIKALGSKLLACITHRTAPITLVISGNHHKVIQSLVIPSHNYPIVLGHPWLKLHNPYIDWSTGSIVSWSVFCHSYCLKSAVTPVAQVWKAFCQALGATASLCSGYHPQTARRSGLTRTSSPLYVVSWNGILPLGVPTWSGLNTHTTPLSAPLQVQYVTFYGLYWISTSPLPCSERGSLCTFCAGKSQSVPESVENRLCHSKSYSPAKSTVSELTPDPAPNYQLGQRVWLSSSDLPLQVESSKLAPSYIGPFEI